MEGLKIRLIKNKKELEEVFNIRNIVFGKEQNISREIDFDGLDNKSKQIIVFYKNKIIGCARIRFIGNKAKLERIAILKKYRGRGFGLTIMHYLIKYTKKRKTKEIYFHAQNYSKIFYEKCGFKVTGKPFKEVEIKHIKMHMRN